MVHPAISVIIPVFNTAPWLRRCLDSVCGQTLHDIEIICIDDGSKDESGAILEEYAAQDPRILTITLGRNVGPGIARNMGLAVAQGEWLGFVDSDDSVALDFYEKLYTASHEGGAEIIKGTCWNEVDFPNCINPDINIRIKEDRFKFTNSWFTAIYNRDFILKHNIRLPPLTNSQDLVFLYHALTKASKVSIANDALYYYFHREGSNSTSLRTNKKIYNLIAARNAMRDILNTNSLLDIHKYISEYSRILYDFYIFFENPTRIEDKAYALKAVSNAILKFYNECSEKEMLLAEFNKYDSEFCALMANNDMEGLITFLSTTRLQRLRSRARARLVKHS